jgi:hypothetical protein
VCERERREGGKEGERERHRERERERDREKQRFFGYTGIRGRHQLARDDTGRNQLLSKNCSQCFRFRPVFPNTIDSMPDLLCR